MKTPHSPCSTNKCLCLFEHNSRPKEGNNINQIILPENVKNTKQ